MPAKLRAVRPERFQTRSRSDGWPRRRFGRLGLQEAADEQDSGNIPLVNPDAADSVWATRDREISPL